MAKLDRQDIKVIAEVGVQSKAIDPLIRVATALEKIEAVLEFLALTQAQLVTMMREEEGISIDDGT